MTIKNFIPQIWSARLLANLDKNLVYANVVNRDYEGEIRDMGDTVKINQMGAVKIKDYDGTGIEKPDALQSTQTTLKIDSAKYFNFSVKDIDAAQANVKLVDRGMERAAYELADEVDRQIAALVTKAKVKVGSKTTPVEVDVDTAYDKLVDLRVELDKANVPVGGRFVVLPPFYVGLLSKDPRFTKDYTILENGLLEGARVAGFQIYQSNNVPQTGGKFEIMAGVDLAISFAGQVTEIKNYEPESDFADAVKGLYVYGVDVIQPEALACFVVQEKQDTVAETK